MKYMQDNRYYRNGHCGLVYAQIPRFTERIFVVIKTSSVRSKRMPVLLTEERRTYV